MLASRHRSCVALLCHCSENMRSSHSQLEQFANKLLINEAKHATAKNKDSLIKLRNFDADDENKEIWNGEYLCVARSSSSTIFHCIHIAPAIHAANSSKKTGKTDEKVEHAKNVNYYYILSVRLEKLKWRGNMKIGREWEKGRPQIQNSLFNLFSIFIYFVATTTKN